MYDLTYEDFLKIKAEALDPDPGENAYAVTFAVMEKMFPGYLYARRNSFPCQEDLEDCLSSAELRIAERIRRYYFEREDMEQTPESLQRWMFTVLKNCYYTALRQSESGREMLCRMEQDASAELGMTYAAEGRMNMAGSAPDPRTEGGFAAVYRKEEEAGMRRILTQCFSEIITGRSDVQIILAWLTVGALMLVRDMKKKDAIALIADADPAMEDLFRMLQSLLRQLPWMELTDKDWEGLSRRLAEQTRDGKPLSKLRFSHVTNQSVREYISKSINKRNDRLSSRHADTYAEFDF